MLFLYSSTLHAGKFYAIVVRKGEIRPTPYETDKPQEHGFNKCRAYCARMRFGITKLFSRVGSSNRTYTCASTAFYASVCVDYVLSITFTDAAAGAFSLASTTADAIIIDNVSHDITSIYVV